MLVNKNNIITAISIMAVMFIALIFSGCATPRQMNQLQLDINEIKRQNQETQQKIDNMESVIVEGAEAAAKLRNDVSSGNDYIQQQIDLLLENYNQLLNLSNNIYQSVSSKKVIIGSTDTPRLIIFSQQLVTSRRLLKNRYSYPQLTVVCYTIPLLFS